MSTARGMAMEVDESDISDGSESEEASCDVEAGEPSFPFVSSDEDASSDLNNFRNVARKGIIWNRYQPIKQLTLYSRILNETEDICTIVQELLVLFQTNSREAVASLLQFCMDVSGLQKFDIVNFYLTERNVKQALTKFTELMFNDEEYVKAALDTTERYLLLENRRLAKYLQLKIYTFLQDFVQAAYTEGLLDREQSYIADFFEFIRTMTTQTVRAIFHTGTVFSAKIITALVQIHVRNDNDENTSVVELMQLIYLTLTKSVNFDRRSHDARVEFCHEICIWCKCMPQKFLIEWGILRYIMIFINDPSPEVRVMILRVVQKLMKNQNAFECFMTVDMEKSIKLVNLIRKRFLDVNDNVVIEAVRVFAVLQGVTGNFGRYLDVKGIEELLKMIFENSFVIAQAACDFMYKFFSDCERGAVENVLNSMAVLTFKYPYGPELLVEGCLQIIPEIQNWSLYIKILSEKREILDMHGIAVLFAEAVSQVLKGCSSQLRKGSPTVNADPEEHNRIADHFPQLVNLISNYREKETVQKEIFKIFSIAKPTTNHDEDYRALCDLIEQLFVETHDKQLLKEIVSTLNNLCDNVHFSDSAKIVERKVVDKFSEQFCAFLRDPVRSESDEMENSIIVYKAIVLFEDRKFTKEITWSLLFNALSNFEPEVLTDLLICCKWHLIWALKELKELKELKTDKITVYQKLCNLLTLVRSYTTLLFKLLTDLEVDVLRVKVYNITCEFYTHWNDFLRPLIRSDKQYEELLLTREPSMTTILIPFLEEHIIKNTEMPLKERQEAIIAYIDMVHKGTIPLNDLVHILKYYDQYLFEYGTIIEASLKAVGGSRDINNLHLVVIATIVNVYEAIIEKYGVIHMNTSEVKALKTLTKRLLAIESYRKPKSDFMQTVLITINYSRNNRWSFLYFAQYFLNLITDPSDFDYILNKLKRLLDGQQQKPPELSWFIKQVKDMKSDKGSKTGKNVPGAAEVRGIERGIGKPLKESTPKTPPGPKKRKAGGSTSHMSNTSAVDKQQVPLGSTPKVRPEGKKVGQTLRYSKSSEGAIDIQDDSNLGSDSN